MFILKGRQLKVHNLTTAAHTRKYSTLGAISVSEISELQVQVNIMRPIINNVKFMYWIKYDLQICMGDYTEGEPL